MVAAHDQLSPVFERDPVCRLRRAPMRKDVGTDITPVSAPSLRAVDAIANIDLRDRLGSPIGHENLGVTPKAVNTGMAASPIGVDRVLERQVVARDLIDDRLALRLDELDPAELRGVERPPGDLEELFGHRPRIEHMFESLQLPIRVI